MMRSNFHILIITILAGFLGTNAALAESATNPWKQRFEKETVILPTELPDRSIATAQQSNVSRQAKVEDTRHIRPKYRINYPEVADMIGTQLMEAGAGDSIKATIKGRKMSAMLSHDGPITIEIDELDYHAEKKEWQAMIYPMGDGKPLAPIHLTGNYKEMVDVPVLSKRVRYGEVITAEDIEIISMLEDRLRKNTLLHADAIIGKSPQSAISPGRPIRTSEVVSAPVIYKNERISMHYRTDAMEITALGEALDNGATGETIRVRNSDSNTVIRGRIIAPGQVEVMPLGMIVAAQ